jgi:outer membrane lipoprotein-sorting protein/peroxiredoxin
MSASLGPQSGHGFSIAGALVALLAAGCTQGTHAKSTPAHREPPRTASEKILDRMVEAYHQADRYQDAGRLVMRYTYEGEVLTETREFSLAVAGPNRLRVRAYDAMVVCDGQNFRATIEEAPGEVLSAAAPDELSPLAVYYDPVLGKALNQIVGSVPLALFLDPAPLSTLLYNAEAPQLDPPEKIGEDNCYRVRIERREGAFVLWIDEQTFVVRRVEYPPDGCRRLLEPYPGAITHMTITAEIDGAQLDPAIDDDIFRFDVPKGAELVKRFDAVQGGSRIPKFKLRALDGRLITRDSLAGKIVVIKFWQKDDLLTYRDDLAGFEQVEKRYQDEDSIEFVAVSADLDEISDDDLRAALAKAHLSLPIARVTPQVAYRSFGLQVVPTTVILGRNGSLQEHSAGVTPDQVASLSKKLDTLLAGGELILEAPREPPNYSFYAGFAWQDAPDAAATLSTQAAPPSEPERLRRKRLWKCSELAGPGNLLVVHESPGQDRLFVVDDSSSVAEISTDGKVSAKHDLELPNRYDAEVTFLRTATDDAGNRYFLTSRAGAQQLHLFDATWKRLLSYPDAGDHPGIADAVLADLDGDGELEMAVGYRAPVGVHGVTLDGQRLWRNRNAENVLRLDVTGRDDQGKRQLLVAEGMILPIDAAGAGRAPIALPDGFVRQIFTADLDGDERSEWCAIALKPSTSGGLGTDVAVGLSPRGTKLWSYSLPEGIHPHPALEMVTSGNLMDGDIGQWVIAAADGSIHILAMDGTLIDRFNYGAAITGLAIANFAGRPTLLVSTEDAVEAWQFDETPGQEETER